MTASRRHESWIAILFCALLVACGTSGAPQSSPEAPQPATPRPAPSPTETPIDVADAFATEMAQSRTFFGELTGEVRVAETTGEATGHLWVVGGDVHNRIAISFPGMRVNETETIEVDGATYLRTPHGYWLEQPAAGSGEDDDGLTAALEDPGDLEVVGTERVGGRMVHRLESRTPPEIAPADLGFEDPTVTDFEAEIAFLAENDGTPAGLVLVAAWTQGPPDARVEVEVELEWLASDEQGEIVAPEDVWTVHESEAYGYRMAHPVTWDVSQEPAIDEFPEMDLYLGPVDGEVQVVTYGPDELAGAGANEWLRGSAQVLTDQFGVEPQLLSTASTADGLEAQVFGLHASDDAGEYFFQQAVVYGGDAAWDVNWYSKPGNEEADKALFLRFVNSFERIGEPASSAP